MEKQKKESGGKETHCLCYRETYHFFSALVVLGRCPLVFLAENRA